ncbi:hypothetical protein F4802DRAFT_447427 [Xylaria palmicola]|nr:hypothetical protein F4802DRAFT_447427 [Xylaria palmicola]
MGTAQFGQPKLLLSSTSLVFITRLPLRTLQTPGKSPIVFPSLRSSRRSRTPFSRTWANFLFIMVPMMPSEFISCIQVPEGHVLYGIQVQVSGNSESCWTKPRSNRGASRKVRPWPCLPVTVQRSLHPYEFLEGGTPSKTANIPKMFPQELAEILHIHNLSGLVALQVLDGPRDRTSTELLVGPQSTIMMDTKDILGFEPAQLTTDWFFHMGEDVISCKGNDVYAPKKNTHGVFQDSKPLLNS